MYPYVCLPVCPILYISASPHFPPLSFSSFICLSFRICSSSLLSLLLVAQISSLCLLLTTANFSHSPSRSLCLSSYLCLSLCLFLRYLFPLFLLVFVSASYLISFSLASSFRARVFLSTSFWVFVSFDLCFSTSYLQCSFCLHHLCICHGPIPFCFICCQCLLCYLCKCQSMLASAFAASFTVSPFSGC